MGVGGVGGVAFGQTPTYTPSSNPRHCWILYKKGVVGGVNSYIFPETYFLFLMIINSNKKRDLLFLE